MISVEKLLILINQCIRENKKRALSKIYLLLIILIIRYILGNAFALYIETAIKKSKSKFCHFSISPLNSITFELLWINKLIEVLQYQLSLVYKYYNHSLSWIWQRFISFERTVRHTYFCQSNNFSYAVKKSRAYCSCIDL